MERHLGQAGMYEKSNMHDPEKPDKLEKKRVYTSALL